jgi:hypothetical protein
LQELYLSPKHHEKVSNFYLEWAYNIMPWIVLDELSLPDPIIRATHYIFGTFVVEKLTTDNRLASAPKILITAWIYDVATARLINSEQIGGHLSTSAMLPKLAEQLGVRITQYIKDRLK